MNHPVRLSDILHHFLSQPLPQSPQYEQKIAFKTENNLMYIYLCPYNGSWENAVGGAVGSDTALQPRSSRVLFPLVSLKFFIDAIHPAAL